MSGFFRVFRAVALAGLAAALAAVSAHAATYYISPSGSDSNTGTAEGSPFKTFFKAFGVMAAADELILLDGAYDGTGTGYLNYDDGSCSACAQPPSGTSVNAMTWVHAKNEGAVTVNGGSRPGLFIGRSTRKDQFIKVQGIHFEGGGQLYNTAYCTIKNCGFHNTAQDGGSVFTVGTLDHNNGNTYDLIEDVWVWGQNRIIALNYRANNNVWRRVVIRGDGCGTAACTGSGNPNVGFSVYDSQNNSIQNMIVIDRTLGGGSPYADFASAQHDPGTGLGAAEYLGPNEWLGCISLNSPDDGFQFEADNANDNTHTLRNVVAWNSANYNFNIAGQATNIVFQNVTAGVSGSGSDNVRIPPGVTGTARDVIAYNSGQYGINSAIAPSYADVYNAASGAYPNQTCTAGCNTTNPLSDGTPASLSYIGRIESGSKLSGADSGADIGADVIQRYGADGARYGDANYNTLSLANLWPWPNQGTIKSQFAVDSARGFAAPGTDLTQYVWGYLGNPSPYASDNSSPTLVSATLVSASAVDVVFSTQVGSLSAENTTHYAVTNGISVLSATVDASDKTKVHLQTSTHTVSGRYVVTATDVRDQITGNYTLTSQIAYTYTAPSSGNPGGLPEDLKPQRQMATPADPRFTFGTDAQEVTVRDRRGSEVFHAQRGGSAIVWDGRDSGGQLVESGLYVCKIKGNSGRTIYYPVVMVK